LFIRGVPPRNDTTFAFEFSKGAGSPWSEVLMKQALLFALLSVSFIAIAPRQEVAVNEQEKAIEKEIVDIEHQRDQAIQDRDMRALDRIHADDFTFVNTRGGVLSKSEYLNEIRTGALKFLSFKQDDYRFQVYGDAVVLTGRSSGIVEYHGKVNELPRRFTIVYVRDHGRWRVATYHGTTIAEQ
jgi:ketosteroid isomerase-like protein